MISVKSNKVEITNPSIVKIFTKYFNNKAFLVSCENILETYCKNTDDFIQQYSKDQLYDQQTNSILLQLQSLEQRNEEFKNLIQSSMSNIADDILSKVSTQLTSLIFSIDNIVSSSVEKLNSNYITETLKDFIKETLLQSNAKSKDEIEQHIKNHILVPINDTQLKLLELLAKLPDVLSKNTNNDEIHKKLNSMNDKWSSVLENIILDVKQLDSSVEQYIKFSNESYNNSPLIIKGVLGDLIHNLEQQTNHISYIINSIQKDIGTNSTNVALIKSTNDDLKNKLDSLDKQLFTRNIKENNNSGIKGSIHEDKLYVLLYDDLKSREGFDISRVNGLSHSCDILIQRESFPNVRIDNKATGEHNGYKVPTSEIIKFERDLLELNEHGILISQFTGIVGKGSIEIKQLPNAKFAIFISHCNYNIPFIIDMLYLIYKLDSIITTSDENSHITLTPETITKIQNIIKDFSNKINSIRHNLKDSITILNSITLSSIEKILLEQMNEEKPITIIKCDICGFIPKNHVGLVAHKRKCDKINDKNTPSIKTLTIE